MTERRPVDVPGLRSSGSTLTKFFLPQAAFERLQGLCGSRGRSHWIQSAVKELKALDEDRCVDLLLQDASVRHGVMRPCQVRLTRNTFIEVRSLVSSFRSRFPGQDLDPSGVLRAATLHRLRKETGLLALGNNYKG